MTPILDENDPVILYKAAYYGDVTILKNVVNKIGLAELHALDDKVRSPSYVLGVCTLCSARFVQ